MSAAAVVAGSSVTVPAPEQAAVASSVSVPAAMPTVTYVAAPSYQSYQSYHGYQSYPSYQYAPTAFSPSPVTYSAAPAYGTTVSYSASPVTYLASAPAAAEDPAAFTHEAPDQVTYVAAPTYAPSPVTYLSAAAAPAPVTYVSAPVYGETLSAPAVYEAPAQAEEAPAAATYEATPVTYVAAPTYSSAPVYAPGSVTYLPAPAAFGYPAGVFPTAASMVAYPAAVPVPAVAAAGTTKEAEVASVPPVVAAKAKVSSKKKTGRCC